MRYRESDVGERHQKGLNMNIQTSVERAAAGIVAERVTVNADEVATALAAEIINEHIDTLVPTDAIDAGVSAAIEEISEATFAFAVDVIRDRVSVEVESQAKAIALRMLRETAAKAERAAAACSPDGGL